MWVNDSQHLRLQRSIHFPAFLTHSVSLAPSPSLLLSLLCHCPRHTLSTCSLQPFLPLHFPLSISFSPSSPLLISPSSTRSLLTQRGMQYVAGCGSVAVDTCDSAAGWVTFICAWNETVLEQVCVFCMCCLLHAAILHCPLCLISVHAAAHSETGRECAVVQPEAKKKRKKKLIAFCKEQATTCNVMSLQQIRILIDR